MSENNREKLEETHLQFAKNTNKRVWDLLEQPERSVTEDEEMLLAAYTSLYHWTKAGTTVHFQRGCWMLSRVYLTLNREDDALEWALKCQEISEKVPVEMEVFDLAFAQEGLARAYALTGDLVKVKKHYDLAVELGENIKDPEDKKIFLNDLQGGNWFGFVPE
jgi:tetratricopeptide (TPR) repeat protein